MSGISQAICQREKLLCLIFADRRQLSAEAKERDPYILWVWILTPDFRGELPGMTMRKDPHVADHYYLLNVMREKCKGAEEDWDRLAAEIMHDRSLYEEVRRRLAIRLGLAGTLLVPKYPD